MFRVRRTFVLRTIVVTRRKAPKFARRVAKNLALSSAVEVLVHHKPPEGGVVVDATLIEGLDACLKLLIHL